MTRGDRERGGGVEVRRDDGDARKLGQASNHSRARGAGVEEYGVPLPNETDGGLGDGLLCRHLDVGAITSVRWRGMSTEGPGAAVDEDRLAQLLERREVAPDGDGRHTELGSEIRRANSASRDEVSSDAVLALLGEQ